MFLYCNLLWIKASLLSRTKKAFIGFDCPVGWLAVGWSCYKVNPRFMSWSGAKQACERSTPGSHLANIKTYAELLSIISFLGSYNHLLLLWTALNDHEVHGKHTWTLWRLLHTFFVAY
uniref:C-type lectin domain-containing protein n=1 Tax=Sinocyclocheilus grahami TaxID=75366 RepID=A0A672PVE1_SINGR